MTLLLWLRSTWLGRALAGALALLAAFGATYLAGKRKGAQDAAEKGKKRDAKRAADIRRAADRVRDNRDGYRD